MKIKLCVQLSDGYIIKSDMSSITALSSLTKIIGKYYNMSGEATILYRQHANSGHQHVEHLDAVRGPGECCRNHTAEDRDRGHDLEFLASEFGSNLGKRRRVSEESDPSTLKANKKPRLRNAATIKTIYDPDAELGANTVSKPSSERDKLVLDDLIALNSGSNYGDSDVSEGTADEEGADEGDQLHSRVGWTGME